MCEGLTWTGVGLEVIGLGLVALELTRVQRRELGTPRWVQGVRAAWRRVTRRPTVVHLGSADFAGSSEMTGRLSVWRGGGETLEQRVAALEVNLISVRDDADARHAELEQRLTGQAHRLNELRADLDHQHAMREAERREQLRESVALQWWGTGLFVVGAILGGLANVSC